MQATWLLVQSLWAPAFLVSCSCEFSCDVLDPSGFYNPSFPSLAEFPKLCLMFACVSLHCLPSAAGWSLSAHDYVGFFNDDFKGKNKENINLNLQQLYIVLNFFLKYYLLGRLRQKESLFGICFGSLLRLTEQSIRWDKMWVTGRALARHVGSVGLQTSLFHVWEHLEHICQLEWQHIMLRDEAEACFITGHGRSAYAPCLPVQVLQVLLPLPLQQWGCFLFWISHFLDAILWAGAGHRQCFNCILSESVVI